MLKSLQRVLYGAGALLAAVAIAAPSGAHAVGVPALPGDPPLATSDNVHLVGHIPGSAAGMNFSGHYAYVTGWSGVTVLDIAKPAAPEVVGELALPHFENEDVDLCGNTLLVVNDRATRDLGSVLYVVSIANPTLPVIQAVLPLGLSGTGRGSGHIANFVKADCTQAWLDGGDRVEVIDLSNPSAPAIAGQVRVRRSPTALPSRSPTTPSSTTAGRCGTSAVAVRPATS